MTTSEQATPRKRRMPRAERERQMMEVAEEVFAERGYVAASMDEIAERVGVSKPMLYEYFGSKEGLLVACIRQARAELLRVTAEATAAAANDPETAFRAGLVAYFRFAVDHGVAWSLLSSEAAVVGPQTADEVEAVRQQQTNLISVTMSAYAPEVAQGALDAFAEIIVGGCERLALWCGRRGDVTPEQAAEHIMRLMWSGLKDSLPAEK